MARTTPTLANPTAWLSIQQAADAKGVNPRTIRRWIASGHLPAERVGPRLLRVRLEDLESLGRAIGGAA